MARPRIPDETIAELREHHGKDDKEEPVYILIERAMTKAEAWETRGSDVL